MFLNLSAVYRLGRVVNTESFIRLVLITARRTSGEGSWHRSSERRSSRESGERCNQNEAGLKKQHRTQLSPVRTLDLLSSLEDLGGLPLLCSSSDLLPHFLVEGTQANSSGYSAYTASLTSIPSSVDTVAPQ